ncbi:hypothetical protein HS088_TW09G00304 [Tripterygium wilfordii]|uniref:Uncharacterized protein n=1 Tax=Tripterygium wilfordii TaxID=458696 RepID=A0A7J7D7A5_TRIWF|nr:hypothetical protein HS088_TW09G00304 [Tripterygium wilfordii]
MVQTRIEAENPRDSQWKTDINMVADLAISPMPDSGTINRSQEKNHLGDPFEPNDLCMLLERDSGFISALETWTVDYGVDISFMEGDRMCSGGQRGNHAKNELPANGDVTRAANNQVCKTKDPTKEAKSKALNASHGKGKYEIVTKSKKPSLVSRLNAQKSRLEKEEDIRKNMEELLIQRQKRIAERTAAAGYAPTKKVPSENKTAKGSSKYDKNKTRSFAQDK